ncbi:MAG TPA: hypothetical protein PK874_11705 [Desulfobacteraceae bacterium]|nr:hypothetical protein [Desulfobacteraceae bacterium]HPQ29211.1 hypothetical protein [Desulfobacteraceae bacterium]
MADSGAEKMVGAGIDYENPLEVRDLMAKHLAKIFIATYKRKIEKELSRLKEERKPKQLDIFQRKEPLG